MHSQMTRILASLHSDEQLLSRTIVFITRTCPVNTHTHTQKSQFLSQTVFPTSLYRRARRVYWDPLALKLWYDSQRLVSGSDFRIWRVSLGRVTYTFSHKYPLIRAFCLFCVRRDRFCVVLSRRGFCDILGRFRSRDRFVGHLTLERADGSNHRFPGRRGWVVAIGRIPFYYS